MEMGNSMTHYKLVFFKFKGVKFFVFRVLFHRFHKLKSFKQFTKQSVMCVVQRRKKQKQYVLGSCDGEVCWGKNWTVCNLIATKWLYIHKIKSKEKESSLKKKKRVL